MPRVRTTQGKDGDKNRRDGSRLRRSDRVRATGREKIPGKEKGNRVKLKSVETGTMTLSLALALALTPIYERIKIFEVDRGLNIQSPQP